MKQKYKQKVELKFAGSNLRDAWKGLKKMAAVDTITDQSMSKVRLHELSDASLPEVVNDFFTRFEEHNCLSGLFDLKSSLTFDITAVIDQNNVTNYLKRINKNKIPGDGGMCARWCEDQLQTVKNDYKPFTLTSLVMKTMEKLIKSLIVPITDS